MTSFDEIIDIALVKVDDYKIMKAYNQSQGVFTLQVGNGSCAGTLNRYIDADQRLAVSIYNRTADLTFGRCLNRILLFGSLRQINNVILDFVCQVFAFERSIQQLFQAYILYVQILNRHV